MPPFSARIVARSALTTLLSAVVFDAVTTAQNSTSLDVSKFRRFLLHLQVLSASTPTDIRFIVQFSDDGGTTWWTYKQGLFASLYYEDQDTASAINESFSGEVAGRLLRLRAVATGTTATATFTATAKIELSV